MRKLCVCRRPRARIWSMRLNRSLLLLCFCGLTPGCQIFVETAYNTVSETLLAGEKLTSGIRNCHLAHNAWQDLKKARPDLSSDFGKGFRDGFADYLEYGGEGNPPLMPPACYRTSFYETPDGLRAIEEW